MSRGQTPVASSSGSLQLSDPGDKSPIRDTPEVVPTSSQTRLQSPAESVPASESTEALEDEFDDDEIESLRQEAVLRRRASSIDADHEQSMPGVLVFTGKSLGDKMILKLTKRVKCFLILLTKGYIGNFIISEGYNVFLSYPGGKMIS